MQPQHGLRVLTNYENKLLHFLNIAVDPSSNVETVPWESSHLTCVLKGGLTVKIKESIAQKSIKISAVSNIQAEPSLQTERGMLTQALVNLSPPLNCL